MSGKAARGRRLAAALSAFQGECPVIPKRRTADTGSYTYSYADLAAVFGTAAPVLARHGLSFTCQTRRTADGTGWELRARLLHVDGGRLQAVLPIGGQSAQALGSSISYARRYAFGALTGVVTEDEDDDGALASGRAGRRSERKAERVATTPEDDRFYTRPPTQPDDPQVTSSQLKKIGAAMRELGITDRTSALLYVTDLIGRDISSRNELTRDEASRLIDELERDLATGAEAAATTAETAESAETATAGQPDTEGPRDEDN